jgi:hypothetical protein
VQDGLDTTRQQAKKAENGQKLKVMEKVQTIVAMQRHIENRKCRAEQGSQQLHWRAACGSNSGTVFRARNPACKGTRAA